MTFKADRSLALAGQLAERRGHRSCVPGLFGSCCSWCHFRGGTHDGLQQRNQLLRSSPPRGVPVGERETAGGSDAFVAGRGGGLARGRACTCQRVRRVREVAAAVRFSRVGCGLFCASSVFCSDASIYFLFCQVQMCTYPKTHPLWLSHPPSASWYKNKPTHAVHHHCT